MMAFASYDGCICSVSKVEQCLSNLDVRLGGHYANPAQVVFVNLVINLPVFGHIYCVSLRAGFEPQTLLFDQVPENA